MRYYCELDTGETLARSNLQLYSLERAADCWNELFESGEWYEQEGGLTERLAFIVVCLGLSLSQLLGQQNPFPQKERIDSPKILLKEILERWAVDPAKRDQLVNGFEELNEYYDAIRHFGRNKDDGKHRTVDQLTFAKVTEFRDVTTDIWDQLIAAIRRNPKNDIDPRYTSMKFVARFADTFDD
jgi:hypothetical protein